MLINFHHRGQRPFPHNIVYYDAIIQNVDQGDVKKDELWTFQQKARYLTNEQLLFMQQIKSNKMPQTICCVV